VRATPSAAAPPGSTALLPPPAGANVVGRKLPYEAQPPPPPPPPLSSSPSRDGTLSVNHATATSSRPMQRRITLLKRRRISVSLK
jgi:hypothetical protein